MRIALGSNVRVKGTKIEGRAAADEMLQDTRRIRVDYTGADGDDNQHWANESDLELVEAKPAPPEDKPR